MKLVEENIGEGDHFYPVVYVYDSDEDDPYAIMTTGYGDKNEFYMALSSTLPYLPFKLACIFQDSYIKVKPQEEALDSKLSLEEQFLLEEEGVDQALTCLSIYQDQRFIVSTEVYKETEFGLSWSNPLEKEHDNVGAVGGIVGPYLAHAAEKFELPHPDRIATLWAQFLDNELAAPFFSEGEDRQPALDAWAKLQEDELGFKIACRIIEDNILSGTKWVPLYQSQRILDIRDEFLKLDESSETYKCLAQSKLTG